MNGNRYADKCSVIAESCSIGAFSTVGKNCRIGEQTKVGSYVCISNNVVIGNDCVIGDMVTICDNVEIASNTLIEPGVVFTAKLNERASMNAIPQKTRVGKNVKIHSRAIIESGSELLEDTIIGYGEIIKAVAE